MKLSQIYKVLEEYAPLTLSDEMVKADDGYDNSGVISDSKEEIESVVFTLDLTKKSVEYAKSVGAKLIVTHHPAIFYPVKQVSENLTCAIKNGISVVSFHLNFDVCLRGVDYYFAEALGAKEQKIIQPLSSGCGYGRLFESDKTLEKFLENAKLNLKTDKIIYYGDYNAKVGHVASFCGAGLDEKNVLTECDTLVSCDVKHHLIVEAVENGKKLVCVTHFSAENYGMKRICENLSKDGRLINLKFYFFDDERFY